jgi:hypothetical protein
VVLPERDEQQRRAAAPEMHLGRRVAVEVRERALAQHGARGRHVVAAEELVGLLLGERVGERVVELLLVERDRLVVAERVAQHRRDRADRRERQVEHALYRRGGDPDAGGAEPAVEQHLRERAAERVAHDDRRARQLADDPLVVVDDRVDLEAGDRRRVGVEGLDLTLHARPGGRDHLEALLALAVDPALPAARRHPEAVDEHDRVGPGGHGAAPHGGGRT